jgi:hypothetical protein
VLKFAAEEPSDSQLHPPASRRPTFILLISPIWDFLEDDISNHHVLAILISTGSNSFVDILRSNKVGDGDTYERIGFDLPSDLE